VKLSEHFTLEEMTASPTATRHRIDNTPDARAVANLRRLAGLLEQIRGIVAKPVIVSSGFRSPQLNAAVGGARGSAHLKGLAADISVPGMSCRDLARAIVMAGLEYDQMIYEGGWVHVGLSEGSARGQVLTASFTPAGLVYAKGLE